MTQENQDLQELVDKTNPIDIRAALFKKGDFGFIVKGVDEDGKDFEHTKQKQALEILTSNKYSEFLFGGAANGAKSWTGCVWLLFMCICYPGTRYYVARKELKDIVDSVLVTFRKVFKLYGFTDYNYNAVKNFIQFGNGSHINFIELKYKPSDPMFEDVGSTEYTCGWLEEVGEIHVRGAAVISKRAGRHLNTHYGIKKMVFYTCNPKKNWAKKQFYDKWLNGTLERNKFYLPSLVQDNPFREKGSLEDLQDYRFSDKVLYERLYKGNWDYEGNPNALCEYNMIEAIFSNDQVPQGKTFITADIARFGSDKAVVMVWRGWRMVEMKTLAISKTTDIQLLIHTLRLKYHVPKNRCIVDADGVGGGVQDALGVKGFINNSRPLREQGKTPNYKNLKTQCMYHLARIINQGEIWLMCELSEIAQKEIKDELDQIQSKLSDVGKLDCKSKSDIKQDLGRSPDYLDTIMMRYFFELKRSFADLKSYWE